MPLLGGKQGFSIRSKEWKGKTKTKQKKTNKEGLGPSEVAKNTNKRAFQLSVKISFLRGCPKIPFFDNLAQKARTQKNTLK